jgi:hypothetical protein
MHCFPAQVSRAACRLLEETGNEMTEAQLRQGIQDGTIENMVHIFVTDETIKEAGRLKDCSTVRKLAWKKYVESVATQE